MKTYIRSFLFFIMMFGLIVFSCWISSALRIAEMFTRFLSRHIWLAAIIAIWLLVSYIKSNIRKTKEL